MNVVHQPAAFSQQRKLYTARAFWDYHLAGAIISTSQNESTKHNNNKNKKRANIK